MNKKTLNFPKGFLWGISTSAYQIEGGIKNDWSQWEKSEARIKQLKEKGENPEDFICGRACDSYNRYEEDLDLVKELNCGAYRMGIEWARIEPEKGRFDMNEIEHYQKVLIEAKKRNLKVVLTLWHWTNPIWLAKEGGWENKKVVDYFSCYTELIVKELGKYVDYWVTLNEPMVHVLNGCISGKFPPNKKSFLKAKKVLKNLVKANNDAYKIIHKNNKKVKVGTTQLINYFEPTRKWNFIEVFISKILHYFWNYLFLKKINKYSDYIGVDYYFHDRIFWKYPFIKNENKIINDMGWEIYPKGIYHVLKFLGKFKKPIYIMENGIADRDDKYRVDFIKNHLFYVHKATSENVDVRGYFYWSLLDNFEWAHGFNQKFGLYKVDRESFKRTPRPSAEFYADICKNNRIKINL